MPKKYIITCTKGRDSRTYDSRPLTLPEAIEYYSYTLECGASWQHEKGNKKINRKPATIKGLLTNLNNSAANGWANQSYAAVEFID
jgi:hypothetical protein